ncbi:MAG: sodium:proton antiporter [Muribaculaceae bacterium]|nr:sodium:proton antiporter [Muribaculaceae bacterium]
MEIPVFILLPFVAMLLCIAVAPLVVEHWWERNSNKLIVSIVLALPVAIWMIVNGLSGNLVHQMLYDYVPFIILLMSLFVVTGGINIKGNIEATPKINTTILGFGYLLASFMGTTGAAMLLIRPLISTNQERTYKVHTVLFFIACVANCGGVLTPLGDPPLFLLFQRGADFTWFFRLVPEWAFVGVCLLVMYYFIDRYYYKKEPQECIECDKNNQDPLKFSGLINIVWLLCVVLCVMFVNQTYIPVIGEHDSPVYIKLLREICLVAIILLSLATTKKQARVDNKFSWTPIIEVAVLFVGIFATMTPALIFLQANASQLGITAPWQFYYCTGALSSFLDNAPTAVAFHSVAGGLPIPDGASVVAGIPEILLKAISLGAVFFGAMTYIGNGPNFMVKAIAEENGISMPSFVGYMVKFSLIILLPIYIITQLIFL